MARAVLPGVAHHLTQRGLDRQDVFFSDTDYEVYLALVLTTAERFGTDLLGYCLMSNHVHWVVTPQRPEGLARTFGEAHGRYAAYVNAKCSRSGHFWQNRFFSCALDRSHLWMALRYVERNPVRARMVACASDYKWSSAGAHTGGVARPAWLQEEPLRSSFTSAQWDVYVKSDNMGEAELELRKNTYTGRPSGSREFVEWAEASLGRKLAAQAGGRPRATVVEGAGWGEQAMLFEAE
jgi:putative transposase